MTDHDTWMRTMVEQLELTERATFAQHQKHQQDKLRQLVEHAIATVPAYRDRLRPLILRNGEIGLDGWQDVPILTKEEAVAFGDDLVSKKMPASYGEITSSQTSGSSGRPYLFIVNQLHHNMMLAIADRYYRWHNIDYRDNFAAIGAFEASDAQWPEGRSERSWCLDVLAPTLPGKYFGLNINTPIAQQVEWLLRVKPDYLFSFASNLRAIALAIEALPDSLTLKGVLNVSETLSDDAREVISRVFKRRPIDCYSSAEAGFIAIQSPKSENYLVQTDVVHLEVVNSNNEPCRPEEMGRVVITPLHNFAQPLIRYELGDMATLLDHDQSGLPFPVLSDINGRIRNLFRLPGGRVIQPVLKTRDIQNYLDADQWQIAQIGPTTLEVRIVPKSASREINAAGMTKHLSKILGLSLNVKYKLVKEIKNPRTHKHEDYVCELPED